MFYSLTGDIVMTDLQSVAISCGGVAFKCSTSVNTLRKIGSHGTVTLYTHLAVREDALELFGFYETKELDCFKMLISVSGVGPKAAISILSEMTPEQLTAAVAANDSKSVTRAQGVGPKIAQRIILELKGKLSFASDGDDLNDTAISLSTPNKDEAVGALQFLGYTKNEALRALRDVDSSMSVENMIKQALAVLSKNI